MSIVSVSASSAYDILIGKDLFPEAAKRTASLVRGRKAAILSDSHVWPLYGESLSSSLEEAGFFVCSHIFPAGEASKTPAELFRFLSFLAKKELTREDVVFALGGGVTGDMAGLAASLYQRGIPCIQLPTSLLAMVDSSVGGKTAVDLPEGKNLVGTFSQPALVVCDLSVLKTLPDSICAEGFAEIIKYGMIRSNTLLETLSAHTLSSLFLPENADVLEAIVTECVSIKRDIVERDEKDLGERQLLNFGHTLGHAVEKGSNFSVPHGKAVAIGMAIFTRGIRRLSRCPASCEDRLLSLLDAFCLPSSTSLTEEDLLAAVRQDKKRRGDRITLVVPVSEGKCELFPTDFSGLQEILHAGYEA